MVARLGSFAGRDTNSSHRTDHGRIALNSPKWLRTTVVRPQLRLWGMLRPPATGSFLRRSRPAAMIASAMVAATAAGLLLGSPGRAEAADATFDGVLRSIPGLTHYYPLDAANQAHDVIGNVDGINHGATFGAKGATFDGRSYIELPDHDDFSAATTGGLTVVVFNTINDWHGAGASEFVHWMGKGGSGAHEWTYRHYIDGGSGEAASRHRRTSFYHFNSSGGLGTGSYFQDPDAAGVERMVAGAVDRTNTYMYKNGMRRDVDHLSEYNVRPVNTNSPVRLGTRDLQSGFLVGNVRRVAFFNRKLTDAELQRIYAARDLPEGVSTPTDTHVTIGPSSYRLAGTNMRRETDALVRYTPGSARTTGTNQFGAEAVVRGGVVRSLTNSVGNAGIPSDGYVLSGHGTARKWLQVHARVGTRVSL